jgi:hypothetical protein
VTLNRPGADLSDWFNYGFDEISWEAYCKRREIMGDMADKLKINVLVRETFPSCVVAWPFLTRVRLELRQPYRRAIPECG